MTLRLGGDGAITGCTSLENPDLTVSGLTISGSFDAEKVLVSSGTAAAPCAAATARFRTWRARP